MANPTSSSALAPSLLTILWQNMPPLADQKEMAAVESATHKAAMEKLWGGISGAYQLYQNVTNSEYYINGTNATETLLKLQDKQAYENMLSWGDYYLGSVGKAISCLFYRDICAEHMKSKFPSLVAYYGPKTAFETGVSISQWVGENIWYYGSQAAEWANLPALPSEASSTLANLYSFSTQTASDLSNEITKWMIGQAAGPIFPPGQAHNNSFVNGSSDILGANFSNGTSWTNKTIEPITADSDSTFHATHIIGQLILLGVCSRKAFRNMMDIGYDVYLLGFGIREVRDSHSISPTCSLKSLDTHTLWSISKDIFWKSIFTGIWGTGAYHIYNGIYDHLLAATGENTAHAIFVIRTITLATTIAPIVCECLTEALYAPASISLDEQETTRPNIRYISELSTSGSFDDNLKALRQRDATEPRVKVT